VIYGLWLVVLYGCETLSLTLREEHGLRVFENRVLRRIFGPKRDEVMGGWRKLQNEELHNLYCSPSVIRMIISRGMRWTGHVERMGEKRGRYRILVGKPEGKRSLGRLDVNGMIILRWILEKWDGVVCTGLIWVTDQWRTVVNAVMNLRVPGNFGKFLSNSG
jgi:hypothetical protein